MAIVLSPVIPAGLLFIPPVTSKNKREISILIKASRTEGCEILALPVQYPILWKK
jgi:hypothetical protein